MFKLQFIGLTEQNAPLLAMTPPPASREPPQGGSLLPKPAEIRYPISDSYPRPKAPSPRGLRPQAVGEFTVKGIFPFKQFDKPQFEKIPRTPCNIFEYVLQ